jgi:hypothetical protein
MLSVVMLSAVAHKCLSILCVDQMSIGKMVFDQKILNHSKCYFCLQLLNSLHIYDVFSLFFDTTNVLVTVRYLHPKPVGKACLHEWGVLGQCYKKVFLFHRHRDKICWSAWIWKPIIGKSNVCH